VLPYDGCRLWCNIVLIRWRLMRPPSREGTRPWLVQCAWHLGPGGPRIRPRSLCDGISRLTWRCSALPCPQRAIRCLHPAQRLTRARADHDRTTRGSDSAAPARGSPTDEHAPPSSAHTQGILREYPDHGDELHEQAIPGCNRCNRGRIRTIITAVPHTHATAGGGFP
jgi:hypothetical protein